MSDSINIASIEAAASRINGLIKRTEALLSPSLSKELEARVYLKLENTQHTGSFKLRGASNMVLGLTAQERQRGVVTASTGNHGSGVSFASKMAECPATVFVPKTANEEKLKLVRENGATVLRSGDDCVETEFNARAYAAEHRLSYIPPYNHREIIAGQGTVGLELLEQIPTVDKVFVAVGGGGLISGIATALKARRNDIEVIACSPENSCVMHHSLQAGTLLDLPSEPTLSDSTAGGIEPDSITFPICQALVDDSVTVSESEIAEAMGYIYRVHGMVVEGAAGVALAGLRRMATECAGQTVCVVLCGSNVPKAIFESAVSRD